MNVFWVALLSVRFTNVAVSSGLHFVHYNAATEEKYMVETMGSGGGFFDYDGDGDLDVYLLNGVPLPGSKARSEPFVDALYRNNGDGTFTDVTREAGFEDGGYGMGMAAADVDNDGDVDLYVTNFGPNVLYRNNGDGTFTDVTARAGVAAGDWSSSAAFGDFDGDGFVDLFVCRYVDFSLTNHKFCGNLAKNIKAYCHPDVYDPVPNILYRNNGDGTFTDVTRAAGVLDDDEGKSLGVVWGDYDNDGDLDVYVANDSMRNFLYRNDGFGRFTDVTLTAGVGYSEDGKPQAGMGTDFADADGDGFLDIIVTNLDFEYNAYYHGGPGGVFTDQSYRAGLAEPSLNYVGFGAFFFDYDNDGALDLFVANGHIIDNVHLFNSISTYREKNFLFRNSKHGTFEEMGRDVAADLQEENVARGAAAGDFDRDGDEDVLVTRCGEAVGLFRNDGGNENGWIGIRLVGRFSNRDAIGARVTITADGTALSPSGVGAALSSERRGWGPVEQKEMTPHAINPMTRFKEVKAGSSYLSQGNMELLFGLGKSSGAQKVEVRWPSGHVETLGTLESGSRFLVVEGLGVVR